MKSPFKPPYPTRPSFYINVVHMLSPVATNIEETMEAANSTRKPCSVAMVTRGFLGRHTESHGPSKVVL